MPENRDNGDLPNPGCELPGGFEYSSGYSYVLPVFLCRTGSDDP
jgi:hypothetical protein